MGNDINFKRTTVSIPADVDFKFKKLASRKFKFEKGWYSKAMVEAMELWLKYNDFMLLKEGTGYVGRFLGMQMWERLKRNSYGDLDIETDNNTFNSILRYFNRDPHIENINYKLNNKNLKICLNSPKIKECSSEFMVEDLLINYLQPITIITRAGLEEMTGESYKINKFDVGHSSKIHLKKVKSD